jgi:hypothetical protein
MDVVGPNEDSTAIAAIHDPVAQLANKIETSLDSMIQVIPTAQKNDGLRTILTVLNNIRDRPNEQKYREVRLSALQKKLGSTDQRVLDFMNVIGFKPVEGQNLLRFVRNDDVLLYLAVSAVNSRLSPNTA